MNADFRPEARDDIGDPDLVRIVHDLRRAHREIAARDDSTLRAERLAAIVQGADRARRRPPPRPTRTPWAVLRRLGGLAWTHVLSRPWAISVTGPDVPFPPDLDIPDQLWLEMLWEQNADAVARFLARQVGDQSVVDDLVQQTFLAALNQRRQIEIDARAWLFGVAKNHVRSYWRQQRRDLRTWHHQVVSAPLVTDGGIGATELAMDVADALGRLTAKERECLALSFDYGLNDMMIARVLHTSRENVRQRRRRARWKLYQALGPRPVSPPGGEGRR